MYVEVKRKDEGPKRWVTVNERYGNSLLGTPYPVDEVDSFCSELRMKNPRLVRSRISESKQVNSSNKISDL